MFVFSLNFWVLKYNNFNLYFYKNKIELILIFIYLIISMSLIVYLNTKMKNITFVIIKYKIFFKIDLMATVIVYHVSNHQINYHKIF